MTEGLKLRLAEMVETAIQSQPEVVDPAPIAQRFIDERTNGSEDGDILQAAYLFILDATRRMIRKQFQRTAPEDRVEPLPPQLELLTGYKRVQLYYSVRREGRQVDVRVDILTPDDRLEIEAGLRADIAGTQAHLRELLEYWERLDRLA